jgi:uncharacterized protein YndB with AHSA1/START domain
VWSVITEVDHMKKWVFERIQAFEASVGFETDFIVDAGEKTFDHRWKIIEVKENRKISYNWRYEGYTGDSNVHFELFPQEGSTLIRLTTEIIEDFPQDIPEFRIESCISGWNYFIKDSLPKYLETLS